MQIENINLIWVQNCLQILSVDDKINVTASLETVNELCSKVFFLLLLQVG